MSLRGYNTDNTQHVPVMLQEVLAHLSPQPGAFYVDATFGVGGYSRAILEEADCHVLAIDRDPDAVKRGASIVQQYPDRFRIHQGCFGDLEKIIHPYVADGVAGIVFDIGVSSPQFDQVARGFSFQHEGPLDMRMSQEGRSAADVVNTYAEQELANIIWQYGEERRSRTIAKAIVRMREIKLFETTKELAELVLRAYPKGYHKIHPATKTFQALRLYVNDELGELERGLAASEKLLAVGGRLVVVTFHSLEDRIVKHFFQERVASQQKASRLLPGEMAPKATTPTFKLVHKKPVLPTAEEIIRNPRARSAKLRAGIKIEGNHQMRSEHYGKEARA